MADFLKAQALLLQFEGGYVHDPLDRGGETLCGIARKFHPNWGGWDVVDSLKERFKGNMKGFKEALKQDENLKQDIDVFFRRAYWNPLSLDSIDSQVIAENIYLLGVHAGLSRATKVAQEVANEISNAGLKVDGKCGAKTIAALNKIAEKDFKACYDAKEQAYYKNLTCLRPEQTRFLKGWLNRSKAV